MKKQILLFLSISCFAYGQEGFTTFNRTIEKSSINGETMYRLNEANGSGVAWINGEEFRNGTIELDLKGSAIFQKSFLGIAFHGVDDKSYEAIYFRPFNFDAADPIRKIHAVQYVFEPEYTFQKLREIHKDEYEAAAKPEGIDPANWFHVKIEIKNDNISVYLNNVMESCFKTLSLNKSNTGTKIGFWVGNNSNGEFKNLTINHQ